MRYLFLIASVFFSFTASGQVENPEFTSVAKKFESGKYESALESAESLIDNDKHRKKPEPYLWASMCLLELSRSEDEKIKERYKNALKDALKYGGKAVTKDKNGNLVENNEAFFTSLKEAGIGLAQSYIEEDNSRKASYTFKQILSFAPNDLNVVFVKAITDIRLNNTNEAERALQDCFPKLTESYKNLDYTPDPITSPLLHEAVIFYIDHLMSRALTDSARSVTFSARLFFPLDVEINKRYEQLK